MQQTLTKFASGLGLTLTVPMYELLAQYADLIWLKKDMLNLTSVSDKNEIFTRHICDGLAAASVLNTAQAGRAMKAADLGTGAGYIGLTCAIVCHRVQVTLIDSLQKRCAFLNWATMKLGLKNVTVENIRLGQQPTNRFDFVTERAMGPLPEILPLAASCLQKGGDFLAYQSQLSEMDKQLLEGLALKNDTPVAYILPGETQTRYLMRFKA